MLQNVTKRIVGLDIHCWQARPEGGGGGGGAGCDRTPLLEVKPILFIIIIIFFFLFFFFFGDIQKIPLPRVWKIDLQILGRKKKCRSLPANQIYHPHTLFAIKKKGFNLKKHFATHTHTIFM